MTPQLNTLLHHLIVEGSISDAEARLVHKIRALPRRVADLKEMGVSIVKEWRTDVTNQRYVRYFLVSCPAHIKQKVTG